MEGKMVVIAGASDGIGAQAARQFHCKGANVVLVVHAPEKTHKIADELGVNSYLADFAKLDDVRKLAHQFKQDYPHIDALLNKAGGIFGNRELTIDGQVVCKSQHSAGNFCTIQWDMRYTLERRDQCLAVGEDADHGESTRCTHLAFRRAASRSLCSL